MRGRCGDGKGTLCMKCEMCLQAEGPISGGRRWEPPPCVPPPNLPLPSAHVSRGSTWGPRDGVAVDKHEELAEDIEERPVGQDTDALAGLQRAASHGPSVHHAQQPQAQALLLRQPLPGKRLVELDGRPIHLCGTDSQGETPPPRRLSPQPKPPILPYRPRRQSARRWRRRVVDTWCRPASSQWWPPWAGRRRALIQAGGRTRCPARDNVPAALNRQTDRRMSLTLSTPPSS